MPPKCGEDTYATYFHVEVDRLRAEAPHHLGQFFKNFFDGTKTGVDVALVVLKNGLCLF